MHLESRPRRQQPTAGNATLKLNQGSVSIVTSQRTTDSRSALKLVRCGLTTVTSPHTRSGVMIAAGTWFATLKTQHPAPRLRSPDVSSFRLFGPD